MRRVKWSFLTSMFCVAVANADSLVVNTYYDQFTAGSGLDAPLAVTGLLDYRPFNSSLGTLNSITINWTADIDAQEYYFTEAPLLAVIPYTLTWTGTAT